MLDLQKKKGKGNKMAKTTGVGTHGHKRGRPMIFKRDVLRGILNERNRKGVSLRSLCEQKGLVYISVVVALSRYGMRAGRVKTAA